MKGIIFFILCFVCIGLQAQVSLPASKGKIAVRDSLAKEDQTVDTIPISYRFLSDLDHSTLYTDSLFNGNYDIIDPAFRRRLEYRHLGNAGSAAFSILAPEIQTLGFRSGIEGYDLYNYTPDNYRIYNVGKSFTDVSFSPLGGRESFIVRADFARRFDHDLHLSINFDRIAQQGSYAGQLTKASNFGVTLYYTPKNKYRAYLTYISNAHNQEHNGGIKDGIDLTAEENTDREFVDVNLTNANSRLQSREYRFDHFYHWMKNLKLGHQCSFRSGYRRYGDVGTSTKTDSLIYKSLIGETQGLRSRYAEQNVSNTVSMTYSITDVVMTGGLRHNYMHYDNEARDEGFHQINVLGKARWDMGRWSNIMDGKMGWSQYHDQATYQIKGEVAYSANGYKISGNVMSGSYLPSYTDEWTVVNHAVIQQHAFSNIAIQSIGAKAGMIPWGLTAQVNYLRYEGFIQRGNDLLPVQLSMGIDALQGIVEWDKKWGVVGTENTMMWQQVKGANMGVPEWYSKNKVYIEGHLFKHNLLAQFGIGYTYMAGHRMLGYIPLNGSTYISDATNKDLHRVHLYVSGKVRSFRFFGALYNGLGYLSDYDPVFSLERYPINDPEIRLGISWRFID